jgi:exosortase
MTVIRAPSTQSASRRHGVSWAIAVLWVGFGLLAAPTIVANFHQSWTGEQGEQAPFVLAIGLWLIWRAWPAMRRAARPGSAGLAVAGFLAAGSVYVLGRVWNQFEVESYGLYLLALAGLYATIGGPGMRQGWFPLAYVVFALPPPYTVTWFLTSHLRLLVTEAAVGLFQAFGFSIVRDGLNILVDQYDLAVQNACSGMNSLFSLSAIGLVYVYLRRGSRWWYLAMMLPPIVAFAIFGNFVRIAVLVALTHYFGDAVAQSFLHEGTGFLTFFAALLGVFLVDAAAAPVLLKRPGASEKGRDGVGLA